MRLNLSQLILCLLLPTAVLLTACGLTNDSPNDQVPSLIVEEVSGPIADSATKVLVTQDAPYRIPLTDLQNAGLALDAESFTADNLHLSTAGQEIPYLLQDDTLLFYGQASDDLYQEARPYILRTGQPGTLISPSQIAPTGNTAVESIKRPIWLEESNIYSSNARTPTEIDTWFWHTIHVEQKYEVPLVLENVGDGSGTMQIKLWGQSHDPSIENDHDIDLVINGQTVDTIRWDGNVHYTATLSLPPGTLQTGDNTILFDNQVPGATFIDISQLNWIDLRYDALPTAVDDTLRFQSVDDGNVTLAGFTAVPTILDITNPAVPTQLLTNANDVAISSNQDLLAIGPDGWQDPAALLPLRTTTLRNPDNQADLLILGADPLLEPVAPLVAAREAQGLSVRTVPLGEVYDEFGEGQASPASITNFLRYTQESWADPAPQYLLLVGDGTYDYRNYLGTRPRYHLPAPLVEVVHSGETVSDAHMTDTDGDFYPNLAVGRWPVDNPDLVEQLVERTLAYEQTPVNERTLFTADGTSPEFTGMSDYLLDNSGLNKDQTIKLYGATSQEVATSWNEGAWLVSYVGHGSLDLWGQENVFDLESVDLLNDEANTAVPLVLQFTCLTGFFAHPEQISISEQLLQNENGPVLLIAATSLTLSTQQQPFARDLIQNLQNPEYERVGDALQAAKGNLNLMTGLGLREISDTFGLIGDPSALIARPERE
jgi:hypothetical protein